MGQLDGRCDAVKADGSRCRNRILPKGSDLCMAHGRGAELAKSREDARLRKLSDREMRKPPRLFFEEGWDSRPFRPAMECASRFEVDRSTVTRWYAWVRSREAQSTARDDWVGPERGFPESLWDLGLEHLGALVDDFLWFRGEFFVTARGVGYFTPAFQVKWLRAILTALVSGGRLVILSPPRHGKSELLQHVCCWLICRFPNIRIIWVSGNEELSKQALAAVMDHLEGNEDLIAAFCAPGKQFRPGKQGGQWSQSKFEVATRTVTGIVGPTMLAVGRGGRLRSRNTDFIVNDDVDDEKSTVQASTREETRRWWMTGPESRKEEHTALFYIGSRAHPDDLGGHLLDNSEYESIVEHAHDPACDLPQDDPDRFDEHQDCMLFPQLRSFRWLMSQKAAGEATGGQAHFDMLYQNMPSATGLQVFTAEIVDPCKDFTYPAGRIPSPLRPEGFEGQTPGGIRLVAGLDPSGTGYQAAFLWAFQVKPVLHMWMVDIENNEGGGIAEARRIIREWWEKYQVSHWVVEENLYQGGIVDDERIVEFRNLHGITTESWKTYRNKHDPRIGVTSLAPLFASRKITLPYEDGPSRVKTDAYRAQLIYWDGNAPRNRNTKAGYKSDLVMASWFPLDVIRRAQMEVHAEAGVKYEASYSSYQRSQWGSAPWDQKVGAYG